MKNKIGVVGFSSHVNGKLVFRVNGSYEKNDIIQRFWDKNVSLSPEENLHESIDIVVDTVPANNDFGYTLRVLAIWNNDTKTYTFDNEEIQYAADYFELESSFDEEDDDTNASDCPYCEKGFLMPMYDEFPNWIQFCPGCDHRTEDVDYSPLPY
jgi:hypothetical protein